MTDSPQEVTELREANRRYIKYIREKVNQLLEVLGTSSLKPEELDDDTLLDLDPVGIVAGSFEQVLEHLRDTNKELRIAKDELQAIFDATGVGISIIDKEFRVLRCNEKQRELLVEGEGRNITGRYCYEVYCGKESPGLDCPALDTLGTGQPVVAEAKKKEKHFQIVTTPFKDSMGGVEGVIEVLLDITEKKKAEEEERKQKGFYLTEKLKLATIIQSLSEGLLVTDEHGVIVSFNRAAQKITGYAEDEVVGLHFEKFLERIADGKDVSCGSESAFSQREMLIRSKHNGQMAISINSVLIMDAGRHIGNVFTFRDITEEKKRQEVLHRTEKLVALGQLSAGVAHELNTPLGTVLGYARLLLRDPELNNLQRERLDVIAEQAKRGSTIIGGLLNFSRQSNPANRKISDVDFNGLIYDVLKMLQAETQKRNIAVKIDAGDLPAVKADRRQMEQVIINLVLNSFQAVKNNGEIRVKTHSGDGSINIEITDSGPGIPDETRSRIFDPFFTTKPVGEGTGLGLSICAGIISEHGGSIDFESVEGRGTTFVVTLPIR
jgi:two-component system NtrC family sensor kinase